MMSRRHLSEDRQSDETLLGVLLTYPVGSFSLQVTNPTETTPPTQRDTRPTSPMSILNCSTFALS